MEEKTIHFIYEGSPLEVLIINETTTAEIRGDLNFLLTLFRQSNDIF